MPSITFAEFEIELYNLLNHLFDSTYSPALPVAEILRLPPSVKQENVRDKILETVDCMKPGEVEPPNSKNALVYQILYWRFIKSYSQEKAAEKINMSPRNLRRWQREAIHALALRLWEDSGCEEEPTQADPDSVPNQYEALMREIAALNANAPGASSNLARVLTRLTNLAAYMATHEAFRITIEEIPADIEIGLHPSVLRQIFLYIFEQIKDSPGEVSISCAPTREHVAIFIHTCSLSLFTAEKQTEVQGLVTFLGGRFEIHNEPDLCRVRLDFPRIEKNRVLIIDDNPDQVHLYIRYLTGTQYEAYSLPDGEDVIAQIRNIKPDLIIMDILLPGQDGWDLLLQIHAADLPVKPPVIVSSVMGDERMAASMGATGYLTKPFDRATLLQILNATLAPNPKS